MYPVVFRCEIRHQSSIGVVDAGVTSFALDVIDAVQSVDLSDRIRRWANQWVKSDRQAYDVSPRVHRRDFPLATGQTGKPTESSHTQTFL